MGPPTAPNGGSGDVTHDTKTEQYSSAHGTSNDSNDHQETSYSAQYSANRNQYGYTPNTDQHHLSPEMTSSPSHQNTSGRATPRTMPSSQPSWSQDYQTPPRSSTAGNVYNIVGDRNSTSDSYGNGTYSGSITGKRGRDDDDDGRSANPDLDSYNKRQKMGRQEQFGMPLQQNMHMQAIKTGGGLPRQR